MNKSKYIKNTISTAALLLLIGTSALLLATRFTIPGGFRAYTVLTGSMEPTLPVGSLILMRIPQAETDITSGDIITFIEPGSEKRLITHRVESIISDKNRLFITKGDANPEPDTWTIPYGHIQGHYVTHVPRIGPLLQFIKSPLGLILSIIIPVIIIAISEIKNIVTALLEKKIAYLEKLRNELERLKKRPVGYGPPAAVLDLRHPQPTPAPFKRIHAIKVTPLVLSITTISALTAGAAFAAFSSNSVTVAGNSITTAAVFGSPTPSPSPSPTPTTSPSPTPTTTPEPTPSPEPSPTPTPTSTPGVEGACDSRVSVEQNNTNTAPGSKNDNNVDIDITCSHTKNTSSSIENDVTIDINTGGNTQTGNTNSGNVESGDVNFDLNITND